ncbi:cellulose binding domain-containing protein [Nonomuraea ferruginea]
MTVTNTGAAATSGWRVSWTFADGQRVTQIWNGTLAASGANVTVTHVGWNALLSPGGSTSFGFLASWNGTNTAPALSCSTT